jgi:predicted PurR-regulated permease PerM
MSGDGVNSAGAAASTDQSRGAVPAWVASAVWRGIWQLIAAVLITATALRFARQASNLLRYLILAQLLAFALEPAVTWLHERRGWRRGSATGLLLALFVGVVAEFIPIVGTYLAGAVPVLVALAAVGPTAAVIVLVEILAYQQLENYVLSPRLSQKTMELNAGVAFAAAMAGGAVGGFIGAFFALPIAAVIQSFLSTYSKRYDVLESDLTRVDQPKPPRGPAIEEHD